MFKQITNAVTRNRLEIIANYQVAYNHDISRFKANVLLTKVHREFFWWMLFFNSDIQFSLPQHISR